MSLRYRIGVRQFLRDGLLSLMPAWRIFDSLVRRMYQYEPDFVFLTHPRTESDIIKSVPWVKSLSKFIPMKFLLVVLRMFPCYVSSFIKWPATGLVGVVISTPYLPEELFANRKLVSNLVEKISKFVHRLSSKQIYMGLAAWWPIVTSGGELFSRYSPKGLNRLVVTNGHCATISSLYLSIKKSISLTDSDMSRISVLVIGAGKIGLGLAKQLSTECFEIGLMDKNTARLDQCAKVLTGAKSKISTHFAPSAHLDEALDIIMHQYDIVVCTASNIGYVLDDINRYRNCFIIDDSRPEAFRRIYSRDTNALVVEGGILRVEGLFSNSDFGFGKRRNVFGCLGEAVILAADAGVKLRPSVGELDHETLKSFVDYISGNDLGISVGDWKCGNLTISNGDIAESLSARIQRKAFHGIS